MPWAKPGMLTASGDDSDGLWPGFQVSAAHVAPQEPPSTSENTMDCFLMSLTTQPLEHERRLLC